jgi:hypothetical protein
VLPSEGLNALSVIGALVVVVGSMTCALTSPSSEGSGPIAGD